MSRQLTAHRRAFLRAVDTPMRIYREAGQAWDAQEGSKVTARLQEAFDAGWVEPIPAAELTFQKRFAMPNRTYYRLTTLGKSARGRSTKEEQR